MKCLNQPPPPPPPPATIARDVRSAVVVSSSYSLTLRSGSQGRGGGAYDNVNNNDGASRRAPCN
jgi:hypothetical protein